MLKCACFLDLFKTQFPAILVVSSVVPIAYWLKALRQPSQKKKIWLKIITPSFFTVTST